MCRTPKGSKEEEGAPDWIGVSLESNKIKFVITDHKGSFQAQDFSIWVGLSGMNFYGSEMGLGETWT